MSSFHATRTSPDGIIQMDDNLGLFTVGNEPNTFAHSPKDVAGFRIVIDKDYINPSDSILIEGGHIAIRLKEPVDEICISYGSKHDSFGARHEVKKALEPDLEFLEEITGLRRG